MLIWRKPSVHPSGAAAPSILWMAIMTLCTGTRYNSTAVARRICLRLAYDVRCFPGSAAQRRWYAVVVVRSMSGLYESAEHLTVIGGRACLSSIVFPSSSYRHHLDFSTFFTATPSCCLHQTLHNVVRDAAAEDASAMSFIATSTGVQVTSSPPRAKHRGATDNKTSTLYSTVRCSLLQRRTTQDPAPQIPAPHSARSPRQ